MAYECKFHRMCVDSYFCAFVPGDKTHVNSRVRKRIGLCTLNMSDGLC